MRFAHDLLNKFYSIRYGVNASKFAELMTEKFSDLPFDNPIIKCYVSYSK